jgi:Transglycosylase SLT domain
VGSRRVSYRPTAFLVWVAAAVLAVAVAAGCGGADRPATVAPPSTDVARRPREHLNFERVAAGIDRAQAVIDDPASTTRELAGAGLSEQLATASLLRERPATRRATMARLSAPAAATMRTNLAAGAALSSLVAPRNRLPPWRIVSPPGPETLLRYFRSAQARFGVAWQYLAAIEFIETRFGRVRGPSSAGAQGPMQFLAGTWERYGHGNIDDQRDAILAAARYLTANGGPDRMPDALYSYNNSRGYVAAVEDYARRMRADPRAYYGYYYWQVLYAHAGGDVILPVGYPSTRPVRVG